MKLDYQRATISFCMDLTAPEAPSMPIATLIIGKADGRHVAAVASIVPDHLDPISRAVLAETHSLIRRYVDEAFATHDRSAPLGQVLERVYDSLRNTIHVSSISPPSDVELDDEGSLGSHVIKLAHRELLEALAAAGFLVDNAQPARGPQSFPTIHNADLPSSSFWAPPMGAPPLMAMR